MKLDEETALFSQGNNQMFEISRANGVVARPDLTGLPGRTAYRTESGEIWLGGERRVARGTLAGGFVEMELGDPEERITAIGVRGEGASAEAIAVSVLEQDGVDTSTVSLYRFADGSWTRIHRKLEPAAAPPQSDVIWIDDRALIVFGGLHGFVWNGSTVGEFVVESPLPLFEPRLNTFATREDYGTVLGTNDGFLYRLDGLPDGWSPIMQAVIANGIDAVEPVFEGFIFGGPDGTFNQFYPGAAPCNTQRYAGSDVERIVQLGEYILIAGGNPDRSKPNKVAWLSAQD